MRSRLERTARAHQPGWIISACAEQTSLLNRIRTMVRDHLRVCGADHIPRPDKRVLRGSSPRVRSRHLPAQVAATLRGIISACAEQTINVS